MTITTFPINTVLPTASIISSTASGAVSATDVQTAINQLAALVVPYTQGTWTPAVNFGGGATGLTYTSRSGSYIKVGKLVTFWANIVINAKGSSTGDTTITGLPFTSATVVAVVMAKANLVGALTTTGIAASIAVGATTVDLFFANSNDFSDQLVDAVVPSGSTLYVTGSYISTT